MFLRQHDDLLFIRTETYSNKKRWFFFNYVKNVLSNISELFMSNHKINLENGIDFILLGKMWCRLLFPFPLLSFFWYLVCLSNVSSQIFLASFFLYWTKATTTYIKVDHSVENQKFTLTEIFFREIYTCFVSKTLLSRIFFSLRILRVNFRNFHTV